MAGLAPQRKFGMMANKAPHKSRNYTKGPWAYLTPKPIRTLIINPNKKNQTTPVHLRPKTTTPAHSLIK